MQGKWFSNDFSLKWTLKPYLLKKIPMACVKFVIYRVFLKEPYDLSQETCIKCRVLYERKKVQEKSKK